MGQPSASATSRFEVAAELLANQGSPDPANQAAGLLRYLGYDDGDAAAAPRRARMLRAAGRLRRLFLLPVPDAPGLVFLAGEADPAALTPELNGMPVGSVGGSGLTPQHAFESCVGEAVEYLSQFVRHTDCVASATAAECTECHGPAARLFIANLLAASEISSDRTIGWVPVQDAAAGTEAWFPADLCLRRPAAQRDFTPPLKLSTGCAAGPTFEAAALRGMLELIERDATSLWWRGGRCGRAVPADSAAGRAAADLLRRLRGTGQERRTWLLDITTDLGVPVAAAISSAANGSGFAFGLGARLSLTEAASSAIFELCQIELASHIVAAKRRESGDAALNETDWHHLRRSSLIDTRSCRLLQPEGEAAESGAPLPDEPAAALRFLTRRLAEHGLSAFLLDLTRPELAVPVVRVLAPGLQLEPCHLVGERLARAIRETGGGAAHTGGVALM